jgi:hypothetical protein
MVHPSPEAVDIIWEMFRSSCTDPHEREWHEEIEKMKRAMEHRVMSGDENSIRAFARKQLEKIEKQHGVFGALDWEEEKAYFKSMISN